jgi:hypothetical protein
LHNLYNETLHSLYLDKFHDSHMEYFDIVELEKKFNQD